MGTPRNSLNSFTDFKALASLEPTALSPKPFPCGSFSPIENRKAPPPPDVGSARPGLCVGRRKLARHGPSGLRRLMEACNVSAAFGRNAGGASADRGHPTCPGVKIQGDNRTRPAV